MIKKHKKVCVILKYIEHLLILDYAVTGCISISSFAYLVGVLVAIGSYVVGLEICVII